MDIIRWIVLISIIVFCFSIYQATDAHAATIGVYLDTPTLVRGYTVQAPDSGFGVAVPPKHLAGSAMVRIVPAELPADLPAGMRAASAVVTYEIKTKVPGLLVKPVFLLFSSAETCQGKTVYFYDSFQGRWRELPTVFDIKNKTIKASTIFPYATVAVLEPDPEVLSAQAALVVDGNSGNIFFQKNMGEVRSVASLTKLMTALVFLDHNPGWDKTIKLQKEDFVGGATLWAKEGSDFTIKDLFFTMLVGSKNNAAMALMRASGLSQEDFVKEMNQKAAGFGLTQTHFVEPTGLNEKNVSTAFEMAVIAERAFKIADVLKATTCHEYVARPKDDKLTYKIENTSIKVLNRDLDVMGTKTGWTEEAGYNLVTQATSGGRDLIAIVMGAKISRNYEEVYQLLKKYQ